MILPAATIRAIRPYIVEPFCEAGKIGTLTYGLSVASYDVRLARTVKIGPGGFELGSTLEKFNMPLDVLGIVHDKSTLARMGIACQNTVIDPGWRGYLTLELTNHGNKAMTLASGLPIAQIVFHRLENPTERYYGKYQDQEAGPQKARLA